MAAVWSADGDDEPSDGPDQDQKRDPRQMGVDLFHRHGRPLKSRNGRDRNARACPASRQSVSGTPRPFRTRMVWLSPIASSSVSATKMIPATSALISRIIS